MTIVDCAVYEEGRRRGGKLDLDHAFKECHDGAFVWIGLHEPSEQEFDAVAREFQLHELAVEDAVHANQRPKLEVYGESLFVVLRTGRYVDTQEVVELGEVHAFIGSDFLVTVRHGKASDLHAVRLAIEQRPDLLRHGPGAILHAIVDKIVDDYAPVVDGVDTDITQIEQEVFSDSREDHSERIYKLKREVLEFHAATAPLLEPLDQLARGRYDVITEDMRSHFRDVHDHLARVVQQVEDFRELLTGVLEANLTQVNVRQNEDVRKISAWVAILAVPTAIAAIYGMNFKHMPELESAWGYPAVLTLMLVICVSLHRYFKHVGWL